MNTEPEAISGLLNERGTTHGDFAASAVFVQNIKERIRYLSAGKLSSTQQEALDNIVQKIGRIVFGDPDHPDHWNDIAGYAKLGNNGNWRPK
jgi:hypothetical protein